MIRRSRVVIVICPSLEDTVRGIDPDARDGADRERARLGRRSRRRRRRRPRCAAAFGLSPRRPWCSTPGRSRPIRGSICCYAAMAHVRDAACPRRGSCWPAASRIRSRRRAAQAARGRASTASSIFAGERPAEEIPAFLVAADVLVSPRSRGTNTPLKIYQYLRSGKPIVATRLLTHTQVLERRDRDSHRRRRRASSPTASSPRCRIRRARRRSATRARELAETKYSYEAYLDRTRQACAALLPSPRRRRGRRRTSREQVARPTTTTATRSTPIRPRRRRSTRGGSAGRSGELIAERRRDACSRSFVGRIKDRRDPRRRHRHRPGGAGAGPRRRPRDRRRRVGGDAGGRRAPGGRRSISRVRFLPGDVAPARVRRSRLRRRHQPARADARAGLARSRSPSCAASPTSWSSSTIRRRVSFAAARVAGAPA